MVPSPPLRKVYQCLWESYGPQGWWPLYDGNMDNIEYHPKDYLLPQHEQQSFEISVGAILTQNTNWKNVEKALLNLQRHGLLIRDALNKTSHERLAQLIKPAGYFNQKAKKLKILADFHGEMTRENLLKLWGIGKETADSILCYGYHQPIFVVDAYTKRIFHRLGYREQEYDDIQQRVMNEFSDVHTLNELHALLVELGKNICKKEPLCKQCCLKKICAHGQTNSS